MKTGVEASVLPRTPSEPAIQGLPKYLPVW
jgi:hypothetical protein